MSGNLRDEMPTVAAFLDDLRAIFGKEMIDKQIRQGLNGQPTFWAKEGGHILGTRDTTSSSCVKWDSFGLSYVATPDWVLEMRAWCANKGVKIRPAMAGNYEDMKREADEYRAFLASRKKQTLAKMDDSMSDKPQRDIITLQWRRTPGQPKAVGVDYVECRDLVLTAGVDVIAADEPIVREELHDPLEKRLANWRCTVRGGIGGGDGGCCALWAQWYVTLNVEERTWPGERPPRPLGDSITVDTLDGWLVEACVRCMEPDERTLLRMVYVFQETEHVIKRALRLRRSGVRALKQLALDNLKKMLDRIGNTGTILLNNIHAGNVPRP